MRQAAVNLLMTVFLLAATALLPACSLLFGGGDDDVAHKSSTMKYTEPTEPYRRINVTSADAVWQSTRTGNTIAVNSLCSKSSEKRNLQSLNTGILSGVDHLAIQNQDQIQVSGVPAYRTQAYGLTENIPIAVDIVTFRKDQCTYDLAYVARKKTFSEEHVDFNQFLEGFTVP